MTSTRPIFIPAPDHHLVKEVIIEFEWFPGFSLSQKQKSIAALHESAAKLCRLESKDILEVSSRSSSKLGRSLSALNLMLYSDELGRNVSLEAAFQSSKIFSDHGRQSHLLQMSDGKEIKSLIRSFGNEPIVGFEHEGTRWDLEPKTAFYDYLYLKGLVQFFEDNKDELNSFMGCGGFTDIEFNPKKSFNCQARSCALFVGLGGIRSDEQLLKSQETFLPALKQHQYGYSIVEASGEPVQSKFEFPETSNP